MNRGEKLVDEVLEMVGGRCEAEVNVDIGTKSLTRFANSFIHQNVSEDVEEVSLRVSVDSRVAGSSTTATTAPALVRFVEATISMAMTQPADEGWPGLGPSVGAISAGNWDPATASAEPMERAALVKEFVDAGQGLMSAGYCQTEARHRAYGNTAGRTADGRYTTAALDGIHQTESSAGSGHAAGVALSDIDAGVVGALAARRAVHGVGGFDAKPGEYEVVLSPECVATVAIFLDVYGFNGKTVEEGTSFVALGEQQFDETFNLWDGPTDPGALFAPFDTEGTPKRRLDLVKSGVTTSLLHTRRTAKAAGTASTGHAEPGSEIWGPFASNLVVGAGASSVDELVAGVERGVYVSTFNYCRVLDPKTLVVTGLTRNGTFMIENGEITGPVTNMRFTQSFVEALGPNRVQGIGGDGRYADCEFDPLLVHAPSMHLAGWNFTGGAEG